MAYSLGTRSRQRLAGLHPDLVKVVERAIEITEVDFTVLEGMRTVTRQKQLVREGASKTMNSRHLTGHAVDLGAWIGGRVAWDWPLYYKIADAVKRAAKEVGIPIEWGGVWDKPLTALGDIEDEVAAYIQRRRKLGKSAFTDGPHFQLPWAAHP